MDDRVGRGRYLGDQLMGKINISHSPVTNCCLLIASMNSTLKLSVISLTHFVIP